MFFLGLTAAVAASYQIIGFERTSIALHSLAFAENSFIFTPDQLMPYVYRNQDMVNGALFVLALTFLWLLAAWYPVVRGWSRRPLLRERTYYLRHRGP